ncbi:MAG: TM0106 family RecB-like putative nuclease [Bdellovibrionales bacterium]|nr:TM0106 family RecB-like putative nuclease [Bdellovibrionales bacterium]
MYISNNKLTFSPIDIVKFFESEFSSYMDHFEKVVSEEILESQKIHRDPKDPLYEVIAEMGNNHEKSIIEKIEKQNQITKINKDKYDRKTCVKHTLSAMTNGVDKIYQAAIATDGIFGYVDILEKVKTPSSLGDYHYIPCDIKIASHPTPTAIIQLCCYCDILEKNQNLLPEQIKIITRDGKTLSFQTKKFFYFYQFLKKRFLNYHSSFSSTNIPIPNKHQEHRDWTFFSKKRLHELDDISLVANIRQTHCEKLKKQSINTLTELAEYDQNQFTGIAGFTFRTLKDQASLQASSKKQNETTFKVLPHKGERQGFEMLPPPNELDVFFDMEGYPFLAEEGLEYLYGNAINEGSKYTCFWAEDKTKEAIAFKNWIYWVYKRWKQNQKMHIYHYGHYETSTIKRLMGRYGIGEFEVDNLLRNHVFVDLHRVVVQGLRVGSLSYSLKEIEQLYYKKRETYVQSGSDSTVQFFHFLNSKDTLENSPFLKKIEDYNRDDCFSTQALYKFLSNLQRINNIQYLPPSDESPGEQKERKGMPGNCERKAKELLSNIPIEKRGLPLSKSDTKIYVTELLAHLLEFHIREEKPGWWNYFSHFDMDNEELFEDKNTIALCKCVQNTGTTCQIQFEPAQEIGLDIGDKVLVLENKDTRESYKILELDLIKGTLSLDLSTHRNIPTNKNFTLTSEINSFYKINIFKSLLNTANDLYFESSNFGLKKCIHNLLLRCAPDLKDHKGPLILKEENLIEETSNHTLNLNNSILCIQGPPGSGKTYTAAHIILHLIQKGKRVGVTSNSHKAISHLLKMVFEQNKDNIRFRCQKVQKTGDTEDEKAFIGSYPIELVKNTDISTQSNLVGGTVFFFSRENQENAYDYLFVDEASQVSLTNVIAAARSTKNIILLGDQNQLEQPIQGSHPGESGQSALTYYTGGQTTISRDKGFFLPISYRMNPKVCKFISENFYDGKLLPDIKNENQKIILPDDLKNSLPDSGVHFIPVDHSGNRESSEEEAKVISNLYKKLLQSQWIDKENNTKPITEKDILIVAPYNLQVAYLKRTLNSKNVRVASVDKFQGQEAPISILSMSASTIQDAPRGINFLLNKNRLNVAISRAKCLSIIVGSTNLLNTNMSSIENMELMNIWCRIVKQNTATF